MALRTSTEARILDAADELFFTRGVAATPIDAVTRRAGVSAATLYRGYPSKDALLAAALERRQRSWLEVWDRAIADEHTDEGRLLAVFDALDEFRQRPVGARWCAFLGSAAEYADPPAEVARAIRDDADALRRRLTQLAVPLAGSRAADLAGQLLLVVTGDLAMRLRDADHGTAVARSVAAVLVQAASASSSPFAGARR